MNTRYCTDMDGNILASTHLDPIDGKVVQLHVDPAHITDIRLLNEDVRDSESDLMSTFQSWVRVECSFAKIVVFTGFNSKPEMPNMHIVMESQS